MTFKNLEESDFSSFFSLMERSFPASERRDSEKAMTIFNTFPFYHVIGHKNENEVVAFLAYWNFNDYYFIDHLAVSHEYRGKKLGSCLVEYFLKDISGTVVLEVEPPEDEITKKRILFYERLGFHLNHFPYTQPPMQMGQPSVELKIMSYPNPLDLEEFKNVCKVIIRNCYPPIS